MARTEPPFVENEQAAESRTTRAKRISLPVKDDGTIDWDAARPSSKTAFVAAMEQDQHALDVLGLERRKDAGPLDNVITEDHVRLLLDGYAWVERMVAPAIIKKQTKGQVILPRDLVAQVYQFSDQQKNTLAPPGAAWFNANLPDWIKEWIAKVGPGAEFFGGLLMITMEQTQTAIREWGKLQNLGVSPKTNGHAVSPTLGEEGKEAA